MKCELCFITFTYIASLTLTIICLNLFQKDNDCSSDGIYAFLFESAHIHVQIVLSHMCFSLLSYTLTGSPNCPRVNTTVNTTSMSVSIHKSLWRWLPEWYRVEVSSHFNGSIAIVYNINSTSIEVTSLEPDTEYNITVTPCNMAGCNESCDVHSVQNDSDTSNVGGEMDDFTHS